MVIECYLLFLVEDRNSGVFECLCMMGQTDANGALRLFTIQMIPRQPLLCVINPTMSSDYYHPFLVKKRGTVERVLSGSTSLAGT